MTYQEIAAIAKATRPDGTRLFMDVAYDHFKEGTTPKPPFMLFYLPRSDNFSADGGVYAKIVQVHYELYTATKRPDLEMEFETILDSKGLFYNKNESWLTQEQMFLVDYSMEVLYNE